jgi:hypothetical protein
MLFYNEGIIKPELSDFCGESLNSGIKVKETKMQNQLLKNDFLKRILRPQNYADTHSIDSRGNVYVSKELITGGSPHTAIPNGDHGIGNRSLFHDKAWGGLLAKFQF